MSDAALIDRTQLPRPDVTAQDASDILQLFYALEGVVSELGSQQDRNFRIDTDTDRFVLKVCRTEYATVEIEAQNAALRHVAKKPDAPRVPRVIPAHDDQDLIFVSVRDVTYQVRLLEYLDGEQLTRSKHLSLDAVQELGALGGRLAAALSDFDHPGLDRVLQWDLRRAGPVTLTLLSDMKDQVARERIAKVMVSAIRRIQPLAGALRVQPIHHDVTDDNVVSRIDSNGRLIPYGVIDFGDVVRGWVVADLAVTCASLLHHADGDPYYILPAVKAFHGQFPLNDQELKALWPLVVARAGILVASSERQLAIEPDNAYVRDNIEHEREIFETALSVPFAVMEEAISQAVAATAPASMPSTLGRLLPGVDPATIRFVDLGVLSPHFLAGEWSDPGIEEEVLADVADDEGGAATRYGEYRLARTVVRSPNAAETYALHVDLRLPGGTEIVAPFDGRLERNGERVVLVGDGLDLHLFGMANLHGIGVRVARGEPLGTVSAGQGARAGILRVQLCRESSIEPPLFVRPGHAAAWSSLCPSPSIVLGMECDAPRPASEALLERRQQNFARPQKNYYAAPPQIERGWREHMFDITGRSYLDMVNNVTIVGHGHPRLARAVSRQWSLLNTNSRFHYAGVAEFSERLTALAPEGLDTVFLVNSGSEANDLALRLAWAYTGAKNMLCLLEGYHGWTVASDAVSTSVADNPRALETRPDWVHPIASPNTYRGEFRGADATAAYVETAHRALDKLEERNEQLAGIICESVYGNAGGIPLPSGYLEKVYAMVRARGGVCIADEVQVGYGRLGHHFWGFDQQNVVPDIITVAKGMGNGHPLGAVITRRDIAEAFEKEGYFFSSAGGSPVSCAVGMAVLDIMEDEALQENARTVGDYLKERLESLGEQFPLIGAVHGMGLYLGVEFVRDRETLAPATAETAAICRRLLDLGVIMQPTGDHLNVLKIKPPLCLTKDSADFFAEMLGKALAEGW
ncbi:aminotransferase [Rhizobiaceae bacterium n13]|uniref:Aminotransferase n=1 Tax=Ferirhizobium litorale TaxID=2927786 RepID=A0AAE3QEE8_9HYPH|nr:aminotransferase [Fererhizobium litorale]MDI7861827.1 aminotransferase [Fererhizobium litorale]MDI7921831.1 aminotransferase [Fererhizobium litorale]